jgi:Protein of unknown function (DUF2845)
MEVVMKHRKICLLLLVPLVLLFVDQVFASDLDDYPALECSGGIVSLGDTKYMVLEKCGKPTDVEDFGHVWIYDYGPEELVRYITFVDDKVQRMQMGGYGQGR